MSSIIANKIAELRAFAKEYEHYSSKMPSDPFALRWRIIADALSYQADGLEAAAAAWSHAEDGAQP
jgi:hypothetical protein